MKLRLSSNTGKSADWLHVQLAQPRAELALGTMTEMPNCKGTVKISHTMNQGKPQVSVTLNGVAACDSFTVESNNGRAIDKTYAIRGGKKGKKSASFTLSWKKVIDKGGWNEKMNNINIKIAGKNTSDVFVVQFLASN